MNDNNYHKDRIANRKLHPETLMMGFGYSPAMSEGALKPPVFLTSTFVFENAQQGKDFFDLTSGRRLPKPGEKSGLVYSRFNHPNMEILEDRLAIWDEAENARSSPAEWPRSRRPASPSCGRATPSSIRARSMAGPRPC